MSEPRTPKERDRRFYALLAEAKAIRPETAGEPEVRRLAEIFDELQAILAEVDPRAGLKDPRRWHGQGRAVDIMPSRSLADWISRYNRPQDEER